MFGCCSSKSAVTIKSQPQKKMENRPSVETKTPAPQSPCSTSPALKKKQHKHHVVQNEFEGIHVKCRNVQYLGGPARFQVPDDKVDWESAFPEYTPPNYTAENVLAEPVWADKQSDLSTIKFNEGHRKSLTGDYVVDSASNMPQNPMGRTGMAGRGLLGRFGPNFAADPVVTRWKRDEQDNILTDDKGTRLLEMVCIKRKDTGEWAIPGGMVERGDSVTQTLAKEFGEEALASLKLDPSERDQLLQTIQERFRNGVTLYEGYCDDPRNTDNAWLETTAVVFHDDNGTSFEYFDLEAGDDAGEVCWVTIEPKMNLYASHYAYVKLAYKIVVGEELE